MKRDIIFRLPAEALDGASKVVLLGDFNNWTPQEQFELEYYHDGSFRTVVALEEGKTYHYRFLLNDGRWVNDYNAQQYVPVPGFYVDNCVITVAEMPYNEVTPNNEDITEKPEEKTKAKKASAPKAKKAAAAKPVSTKTAKAKTSKQNGEKVKAEKAQKVEKATKKKNAGEVE
jgi:hypothetical protein